MTDKPRVWVSRPTFPGIVARLEPHFEVTVEPEERKFSPPSWRPGWRRRMPRSWA